MDTSSFPFFLPQRQSVFLNVYSMTMPKKTAGASDLFIVQ